MRKGQGLVISGLILAGLGAIQLAVVLSNTLPVLLGQVGVVEYYQYMVEAAVQVHSAMFVVALIVAVVLIYAGRKSMRKSEETHV